MMSAVRKPALLAVVGPFFASVILALPFGETAPAQSPRRPFPQHTPYASGSIKPTNITQAALDDSVRSFYNRWKARYLLAGCSPNRYYVSGGTEILDGIGVSEGQGYGFLITALMAGYDPNARTYLDGLYNYYRAHPSENNHDLMAWKQLTGCVSSADSNSATDGDLDIAYGLLLADKQWGSSGSINYIQAAQRIIDAIRQDEINPVTSAVKLGDWAIPGDPMYYDTRTSDFLTNHFRAFELATGDTSWRSVLNRCYSLVDLMQTNYSPSTGLIPDFIRHVNTTPAPAGPNFLESPYDGHYYYNACRDPFRLSVDYLLTGEPRAYNAVTRINSFIRTKTGGDPEKIRAGYRLNGATIDTFDISMAFIAPFAVGAMIDASNQLWLNSLWTTVDTTDFNSNDYYGNTLKMLAMIVLSGNWWNPQAERTVAFSGYRWSVKASASPVGPGPNYFSDSSGNVWVDPQDRLHLRITKTNGQWRCSEVILNPTLGYGRYVFHLNSPVGRLNENAVLGLFTWDDAPQQNHREIDIEFSRWGDASDPTNAQFVVQPFSLAGNLTRWTIPSLLDSSTNSFDWRTTHINFLGVKGHQSYPPYDSVIASWNYTGPSTPSPGNEQAHINLWLMSGLAPSDTQEVEVVVSKFEFNPVPPPNPARWKLISIPMKVADPRTTVLFPRAISSAYAYNASGGYSIRDSLSNGIGYWLRFGTDQSSNLNGDSIAVDTIDVQSGWNLIGSISPPVPVTAIASLPPNISTSRFFRYSGAYTVSDTVTPGNGYWVKVAQTGKLILSPPSTISAGNHIIITAITEAPPPPPDYVPGSVRKMPETFSLEQNYPNPFNPTSVISFTISEQTHVRLQILNVLGQSIATLVDEDKTPGTYKVTWDAGKWPSGLYFYRLTAGGFMQTRKAIVLK